MASTIFAHNRETPTTRNLHPLGGYMIRIVRSCEHSELGVFTMALIDAYEIVHLSAFDK